MHFRVFWLQSICLNAFICIIIEEQSFLNSILPIPHYVLSTYFTLNVLFQHFTFESFFFHSSSSLFLDNDMQLYGASQKAINAPLTKQISQLLKQIIDFPSTTLFYVLLLDISFIHSFSFKKQTK